MTDIIKDYRDYLIKEKVAAEKTFLKARREAAHVIESMSVENTGERLIIQMSGIEKMAAASERWAAADKALDMYDLFGLSEGRSSIGNRKKVEA